MEKESLILAMSFGLIVRKMVVGHLGERSMSVSSGATARSCNEVKEKEQRDGYERCGAAG
jgi:hypothetical protein